MSEEFISEERPIKFISDVVKIINCETTDLPDNCKDLGPETPLLREIAYYYHAMQDILSINDSNKDEITEKVKGYLDICPFINYFIFIAMEIRPSQSDAIFYLMREIFPMMRCKIPYIVIMNHSKQFERYKIVKIIREDGKEEEETEDDIIKKAIKEDSVEKLIEISSNANFNPQGELIFQREGENYYDDKKKVKVTYMQLMAFYGSIKCFKWALIDGSFNESDLSYYAVAGGNVEIIHLLEQKGFSFDKCFNVSIKYHRNSISDWLLRNYKCEKPKIAAAAEFENIPAFLFIHKNGISSSKKDISKALIPSSKLSIWPLIKYLIDNGANIKIKHQFDRTPLMLSSGDGRCLSAVKYLIEKGADVNEYDCKQRTALFYACQEMNVDIVKYLVEHGANLNHYDDEFMDAFYIACYSGSLEIVKYLYEKGSSINSCDEYSRPPLHQAIIGNNLDIVKFLIEKGVSIEIKGYKAWIALHVACENGNLDIVKYLIEKGANIETKDYEGCRALHVACKNGNLDIVKYLIEIGADIEAKDEEGCRPLHVACKKEKLDIVKYLIEIGADIEAKDEKGKTPLHVASKSANNKIVRCLIHRNANIEAKDKMEMTPLHSASKGYYPKNIKYLIEKGANIEAKDKNGMTPLHYASKKVNFENVKCLIEKGANVEVKNANGKIPLELVKDSWDREQLKLVKKYLQSKMNEVH